MVKFLDGVSYGAQAINPSAAPKQIEREPEIVLNRQNRRRRHHDNRRLVSRMIEESKVAKLRKFWQEMFA